ncbi:MAG: hypothetical protein HKP61_05440 [Dactylosporangium sp.]|nr:hypothetical protein [Dactylosporangium sp.]
MAGAPSTGGVAPGCPLAVLSGRAANGHPGAELDFWAREAVLVSQTRPGNVAVLLIG